MPTKNQYANHPSPDTGKLLKEYFEQKRIRKNALARALGRRKTTLFDFLKTNTMQTAILWEISVILKHNFLLDIACQLPADFTSNAPIDASAAERIKELERENLILKAEKDILERVMKG